MPVVRPTGMPQRSYVLGARWLLLQGPQRSLATRNFMQFPLPTPRLGATTSGGMRWSTWSATWGRGKPSTPCAPWSSSGGRGVAGPWVDQLPGGFQT